MRRYLRPVTQLIDGDAGFHFGADAGALHRFDDIEDQLGLRARAETEPGHLLDEWLGGAHATSAAWRIDTKRAFGRIVTISSSAKRFVWFAWPWSSPRS